MCVLPDRPNHQPVTELPSPVICLLASATLERGLQSLERGLEAHSFEDRPLSVQLIMAFWSSVVHDQVRGQVLAKEGFQAGRDLEVVRLRCVVDPRVGEHAPQVRRKHLQAGVKAGFEPIPDGGKVDGILQGIENSCSLPRKMQLKNLISRLADMIHRFAANICRLRWEGGGRRGTEERGLHNNRNNTLMISCAIGKARFRHRIQERPRIGMGVHKIQMKTSLSETPTNLDGVVVIWNVAF